MRALFGAPRLLCRQHLVILPSDRAIVFFRLCSHIYIRVHLSLKFLSCITRMQKDTTNIPHVALAHLMLR